MSTLRKVLTMEVLAAGFRRTWGSLTILLAVPTLLLYFVVDTPADASPTDVVVIGALIGLTCWIALTFILGRRATPESMNRRSFDELTQRMASLTQALKSLKPAEGAEEYELLAWDQASHALEALRANATPGVAGEGWATGESYVSCWSELHRAEAQVLRLLDPETALAEANRDLLRLSGSSIATRADLSKRLASAIKEFGDLGTPSPEPNPPDEEGAAGEGRPIEVTGRRAREFFVMIHEEINDYVDSRYDGLVRLANTLRRWRVLLGLVIYALFVIAILSVDRSLEKGIVESFAVYFLIGVGVGAANEVRKRQGNRPEIDDYGVSQARYLLVPSMAGGAACGAAFIFGLLGANSLSQFLAADLADFDWGTLVVTVNPALVIVAAIFGLAPSRLFKMLDSMGDSLTSDIGATAPTEGADV